MHKHYCVATFVHINLPKKPIFSIIFSAFQLSCFSAFQLSCFSAFLLFCFSAFLLFCFSAFLLFSFSAFQLFSFSAFQLFSFSAAQLFCFSAFPLLALWHAALGLTTISASQIRYLSSGPLFILLRKLNGGREKLKKDK